MRPRFTVHTHTVNAIYIQLFRPEVFNFVLHMHTFDTVPDGIREALGLSDPYFILTSVEDFLIRTSPLFSEQYQDQIWVSLLISAYGAVLRVA